MEVGKKGKKGKKNPTLQFFLNEETKAKK